MSLSEHNRSFLLKGGNWIYSHQGLLSRPTTDLDLLGINISNDQKHLVYVFNEILAIDVKDGVDFNSGSLKAATINESNKYKGLRITVEAKLDSIRQGIQIDIGFGDILTPGAIQMRYPLLLANQDVLNLWAYNIETVIAEKFHAMFSLGSINSRMKDLFDIYQMLKSDEISDVHLKNAIITTFSQRQTILDKSAVIFSHEFKNDPQKEKQWRHYLKKIKSDLEVPFSGVIIKINQHILEILEK